MDLTPSGNLGDIGIGFLTGVILPGVKRVFDAWIEYRTKMLTEKGKAIGKSLPVNIPREKRKAHVKKFLGKTGMGFVTPDRALDDAADDFDVD